MPKKYKHSFFVILVCGTRNYRVARDNKIKIYSTIDLYLHKNYHTVIMHGGERNGVDSLMSLYCGTRPTCMIICPAPWDNFGKAAGPVRNNLMLSLQPDVVLAFPYDESKGTRGVINKARKLKIKTVVTELKHAD